MLWHSCYQQALDKVPSAQLLSPLTVAKLTGKLKSRRLLGFRLKALMQKHIDMSMEIKTLDSDMQNLVYENYNKFISATDTIRSMKANVGSMDTSMASLRDMIGAALVLCSATILQWLSSAVRTPLSALATIQALTCALLSSILRQSPPPASKSLSPVTASFRTAMQCRARRQHGAASSPNMPRSMTQSSLDVQRAWPSAAGQ